MKSGPDFICIGAQKAGTTWLYDNLKYHPQVWLPPFKEIHYFDNKVPNKDLMHIGRFSYTPREKMNFLIRNFSYDTLKWIWRFEYHGNDSMHWYNSLFEVEGKVCGDITPEYTTLDERGVEYAKKVVGDNCKVLIILRDPIERAWSSVKMVYRWKKSNIREEAAKVVIEEMQKPYLVLRTDYSRMIKLWRTYFGDNNFTILFFDDLVNNPREFLEQVCRVLNIQEKHWTSPILNKQSNQDKKNIKIPEIIRTEMSKYYLGELNELSELVGSHANSWLEKANNFINEKST